jgi:hypothetical protein
MRQNQETDPRSGHDLEPISEPGLQITIRDQDIETLTELVLARFPSAQGEAARIDEVRSVLAVASDLRHAHDLHTHCIVVDHRGTRGSNDVRAAGQHLIRALEAYGRALRELAERHPDLQRTKPIHDANAANKSGLSRETPSHHANDLP